MAQQQATRRRSSASLPGSPTKKSARNWSIAIPRAACIHAARPDVRFLVGLFKQPHKTSSTTISAAMAPLPIQDVSWAVRRRLLSWLKRASPSPARVAGAAGPGEAEVVVYRSTRSYRASAAGGEVTYICLVNLLAEKETLSRIPDRPCEGPKVGERVLTWLNDPAAYEVVRRELPNCAIASPDPERANRTADYILQALATRASSLAA